MGKVAWIDVNHKEYSMDEIEDGHLLNIINFMAKGGGWEDFLTKEKRKDLYEEAEKRGLVEKRNPFRFDLDMSKIGFFEREFKNESEPKSFMLESGKRYKMTNGKATMDLRLDEITFYSGKVIEPEDRFTIEGKGCKYPKGFKKPKSKRLRKKMKSKYEVKFTLKNMRVFEVEETA